MTKQLAILPEDTVKELKSLRESGPRPQFLANVYYLRKEGWPLRSIASPLGVSRSAVRNWDLEGKELVTVHNITTIMKAHAPLPVTAHGTKTKVVKIPHDLNPTDRERIRTLAEVARNRTRWSEPNSKESKASDELEELIAKAVRRKVPVATIAKHMGVTRRAVAQRIEKIGV